MYRESTCPSAKSSANPTLNRLGGSINTLGNRNRTEPSSHSRLVDASVVNPIASGDPATVMTAAIKKPRRFRAIARLAGFSAPTVAEASDETTLATDRADGTSDAGIPLAWGATEVGAADVENRSTMD